MATFQAFMPKGRGFLYLAHMNIDTVLDINTNTDTDTDKTVDLLRGGGFLWRIQTLVS